MRGGGIEGEAQAVAAHHPAATPVMVEGGTNGEWFDVHERFHQALLDGCGNEQLLSAATTLRDAAAIYRHWAHPVGHDYGRNVAREHEEIRRAAADRDAGLAADLLARRIDRTAEALRAVAEDGEPGSGAVGPVSRESAVPGVSA
ncbi:FCD domain-containing protein [Streptomyces sp. KMM 9044]|uniref:FCD domain-containing protein n=1 Tax=Streptomyces sp. KMM 9044 TaxID=2744474 RepID=UPI002151B2B5|nr:FCD domain-containing protein [Streptomyces sp. KMM 9044]WAX81481.1 FCD domain-containing protein [Streptomyces sp. KMM 9044]